MLEENFSPAPFRLLPLMHGDFGKICHGEINSSREAIRFPGSSLVSRQSVFDFSDVVNTFVVAEREGSPEKGE